MLLIIPWGSISDDGAIVYKAIYKNRTIVYNPRTKTVTIPDEHSSGNPLIFLSDRYNNKLVAVFEYTDEEGITQAFVRVEVREYVRFSNIHAQGPMFEITEQDTPHI